MVEQLLKYNDSMQTTYNDELSYHHKVPSIIDDLDWNDVTQMIHNMDSMPGMSVDACRMAQQHKQTILAMRRNLTKEKLIMRASYKSYSFHTYPANEFQQKALNYIENTSIYKYINTVNATNPTVSQTCLSETVERVDTTLNHLLRSKAINDAQYIVMHPKRSTIRLNYLYFVPDTSKEDVPLQPIIICEHGPTWNIMKYLSDLLWSTFNQITGCKTFSNSDDLVYAMEQYVKQGYLHETTQFVTLNMNEIGTKFSHSMVITALENFLDIHGSELDSITGNLKKEAIIELVRLVLHNQFFIYENGLYQQHSGSASGSLLTIPLACIYLFYGRSSLFKHILLNTNTHELFGRCRDTILLTWNRSKDFIQTVLNEAMVNNEQQQQQHPSISLSMATIGIKVQLLDLELEHQKDGRFLSKIYRDPKTDEFELPKKCDYHLSEPSSLFKAALQHAVFCCTNVKDYQDECRHLRLSHFIRGFSPSFIDQCLHDFYSEFDVQTDTYFCFRNAQYKILRQRILNNFERQRTLKQQEKQNIIRIPYNDDLDANMVIRIRDDLLNILKDNITDKDALNDITFKLVPRSQSPLTVNDYLVDKRPPLRMLTLPTSERH